MADIAKTKDETAKLPSALWGLLGVVFIDALSYSMIMPLLPPIINPARANNAVSTASRKAVRKVFIGLAILSLPPPPSPGVAGVDTGVGLIRRLC